MSQRPLSGVRVLDAATLAAGPLVATWLGEFGAEVIKVEQPEGGDPLRQWGAQKNDVGLMWKSLGRNKKSVTTNLREAAGRELFCQLVSECDVVIVNLRPSTLTRWGLDYTTLREVNPGLVMLHISGFGEGGPKSDRPGFGTLGEAMSGFAHFTGQPDGPPTLPSFMLADGVAALTATYAVMMALYHRDVHGGTGQLIDVNLIEPLARLIEQPVLTYDQFGTIGTRAGNRWDISAPRNTYQTKDGHWIAISGSAPSIAIRALKAIGREDLATDPRFADPQQRLAHADTVDALMADWVGQHTLEFATNVFERAEVAAAPVYNPAQLLADPHLEARQVYQAQPDPDLGPTLGADNDEVFLDLLGLDQDRYAALKSNGII